MATLKQPELYSVGSLMRAISGMTPTEAQAQLGELERKWPHVPWRVMAAQPPPDEWGQLVKNGFAYRAMWESFVPGVGAWARFELANLRGSGNRIYVRSFSFFNLSNGDAQGTYGQTLQAAAAVATAPEVMSNLLEGPFTPALDVTKTRANAIPNGAFSAYAGAFHRVDNCEARRVGNPYLAVLDDTGAGAANDSVFDVTDRSAINSACMCEIEFAVVPLTSA